MLGGTGMGASLSRLVRIIVLAALALAGVVAEARAQPAVVLVEENDALVSQRDYGYTQGFRASLVFNDFFNKSFVDAPFDLVGGLVVTGRLPARSAVSSSGSSAKASSRHRN